ncbi:MAG: hypothetical protein BZ137_00475 [Methanosphaera sp. rholeuAM130]|nr:MAG: hypothetical protein BZ137_00475 [Methanosphaera sp. rholeuAM130]
MAKKDISVVTTEINKYRTNLLDLSRRNKFLNFTASKSKSIEIINENMLNLFDNLVLKEESMKFLSFDEEEASVYITPQNMWDDESDESEPKNHIQTNDDKNTLNRKLLKLYRDNKSTIEEKGFNSLFLALGFLEWKDASYQNRLSKAPLILIPVKLSKYYDTFKVSWNYEEVRYNTTLKHVLKDINVILPDYDSLNSKAEMKEYLKDIEEAIKNKSGWSVNSEVYLSIFSFKKLAMYEDLDLSRWNNINENNINKLYFNKKTEEDIQAITDYDDTAKAMDIYNVLDADSSQQEVIQNIKNGANLVVEGPPGTGKSQTIVNIIAQLMAMNKSVLFVSEKKVALDVVKSRLDKVGLGDFCLELHGENYNKKAFTQDLAKTLSLHSVDEDYSRTYTHLDNIKRDLDDYADIIYQEFGQSNRTTYQLIGMYDKYSKRLENTNLVNVHINNVENITPEEYDNIMDNLAALSQQYDMVKPLSDNFWRKTDTSNLNITELTSIELLVDESTADIDELKRQIQQITELIGLKNYQNLTIEELLEKLYLITNNLQNYEYKDKMNEIIRDVTDYNSIASKHTKNYNLKSLKAVKGSFMKVNKQMADTKFKNSYLFSKSLDDNIHVLKAIHESIENSPIRNLINDVHLEEKILLFEKYKNNSLMRLVNREFESLRNQLRGYYNYMADDEQIYSDLIKLSQDRKEYNNIRYEVNSYCTQPMNYGQLLKEYEQLNKYKKQLQQLKQKMGYKQISNKQFLLELNNLIKKEELKQKITKEDKSARKIFGKSWNSYKSNPDDLNKSLNQFDTFKTSINDGYFTDTTLNFVKDANFEYYEQLMAELVKQTDKLEKAFNKINTKLNSSDSKEFKKIRISDYDKQKEQIKSLTSNFDTINDYRLFDGYSKDYANEYTQDIISKIREDKIESEYITDMFAYNYANEALKKIFVSDSLNKFNHSIHNKKIDDFRKFDKKTIELNRKRIRNMVIKQIPDIHSSLERYSSLGLLNKEISKKSRHLPIRKTLAETLDIITKIKPCFMMSPMSIAQYLDPECYESFFDYVIFDEASQVKIEDAMGALLRGKNYVIMGDTKQLPPTTFFDSSLEIDEDDEIYSAVGLESILEHAKITFNTKMLKWHYRSRHDSLIAVSNNEFYNNELYVFPSSQKISDDLGLKLEYNNETVYEKGTARNIKEAEQIIDYLFMLLDKYGLEKSIGIATFSKKQRNTVEDILDDRMGDNADYEAYFDDTNKFFIKNIENIQGDERDIILISTGYGFDEKGHISMNFGPLNKDGGERRLNVLITRAKEQCVVFSNFKSSDLKVDKTNKGLQAFKTFLYYADKGKFPAGVQVATSKDSDFENEVYDILVNEGYTVERKVGTASYRIDLAVVKPDNPDEYVLAIECDGSSYHSSNSTRDRDRLHQEILENLGWNFYRVWSTDWYHNHEDAKKRLLKKVKKVSK